MPQRRQHDEPTVMPPNGQQSSHPRHCGWVREIGVGQMKVCPILIGINPAGSIAPFKEGFPRGIEHGLDSHKCRNRREILTCLDALPIPRAESTSLCRLLLRDACLDPHGRNIAPETCATGTGHRLFRWHAANRRGNEIYATRGFTSFFGTDTPLVPPPKLMNAGTTIACSWITLNGPHPGTIPHARPKITAANYAMIPQITGSRRSQARIWINPK